MPTTRRLKKRQTAAVLQPLGAAALGALRVHQFAGGFSQRSQALGEELVEQTTHFARSLDPKWIRNFKFAG